MKIVTAAQMQQIDKRAITEIGIPGIVLMESAGTQVVAVLEREFPESLGNVGIVCGKGNNGGDGFVIARRLANRGYTVTVYLLCAPQELKGDALINADICQRLGLSLVVMTKPEAVSTLGENLERHELIIDAIFGTGLQRAASGIYATAIETINAAAKPVLAVDVPSGLNADCGTIIGPAVRATLTVTFGLPKLCHALYPAADLCGAVHVVDIGIPESAITAEPIACSLITQADLLKLYAPRIPTAHKGTYGHLLILAGSPGKTGAAALCGNAAVSIGAGLVTVGIPRSLNSILEVKLTEAMTLPFPETTDLCFSEEAVQAVLGLSESFTAVALGPGIGSSEQTKQFVRALVSMLRLPIILDADGINAYAGAIELLRRPTDWPAIALTPHPGELSRLLKVPVSEIQQDRIGYARSTADLIRAWVVLKGARTVIAGPDGEVFINQTGNPGLAAGGTGDVLTGLLGGLAAQGFDLTACLRTGVYLHGLIADRIVEDSKCPVLRAEELVAAVHSTIAYLGEEEAFKS